MTLRKSATPCYKATGPCFLDAGYGGTLYQSGDQIEWSGLPNDSMVPLNLAAIRMTKREIKRQEAGKKPARLLRQRLAEAPRPASRWERCLVSLGFSVVEWRARCQIAEDRVRGLERQVTALSADLVAKGQSLSVTASRAQSAQSTVAAWKREETNAEDSMKLISELYPADQYYGADEARLRKLYPTNFK